MTNEAGLEFDHLTKDKRAKEKALEYLEHMRVACIEAGKDSRLVNRMAKNIKNQIEKGRA